MNTPDVIRAIVNGDLDANLDCITEAVKDRRRVLGKVTLYTSTANDRVRFTERISPATFRGKTGTVVRREKNRIVVRMDPLLPWERAKVAKYFRNGDEVHVPATAVEVIT